MTKQELLDKLDAIRGAAEMLPEDTKCFLHTGFFQLFGPDESEIKAAFHQDIMQCPLDSEYDKRFVRVNGVELLWLVERDADDT